GILPGKEVVYERGHHPGAWTADVGGGAAAARRVDDVFDRADRRTGDADVFRIAGPADLRGARYFDASGEVDGGAGLVSEFGGAAPAILKQMAHGFGEAGVIENDGRPGRNADHGVEQRHQTLMAVEERELHGKRRRLADFDARLRVFGETLAMRGVQRSGFDQQTAGDALRSRLANQFLFERIDRIRRPREFQVFAAHFVQHAAVFGGGLGRLRHDTQKVERAASTFAFGVETVEIFYQIVGGAGFAGEIMLD